MRFLAGLPWGLVVQIYLAMQKGDNRIHLALQRHEFVMN